MLDCNRKYGFYCGLPYISLVLMNITRRRCLDWLLCLQHNPWLWWSLALRHNVNTIAIVQLLEQKCTMFTLVLEGV